MNHEFYKIEKSLRQNYKQKQFPVISLFPGIDLIHLHFKTDSIFLHHKPLAHCLQINYCKSGRVGWKTETGNYCYLGAGNFSIHTMDTCANSVMEFPSGEYEGFLLCIDLQEAAQNPPDLLRDTDIFSIIFPERFSQNGKMLSFGGNHKIENLFTAISEPECSLPVVFQRVKTIELLLYLTEMEIPVDSVLTEYKSELIEAVRNVHEYLLIHMEQRITIEELSKQYHINPTTLKTAFKSVYGTSIAAHIKEHRMEKAAKLLTETDLPIAEIARSIGYDSQSKFTSAFKSFFEILPKDYRKCQNIDPSYKHSIKK